MELQIDIAFDRFAELMKIIDIFTSEDGMIEVSVSTDNGWSQVTERKIRNENSLVLRKGIKEKIRSDLIKFITMENHYRELGIAWKRGYLFYGPPGNGKTSLANYIAGIFGANIYHINMSDKKISDSMVAELINDLPERAVVLLEDVSSLFEKREKKTAGESISYSGLLNAMDGMVTPHGTIFILNDNYPEKIDDALIRSGRIDCRMEIGPPDIDMAERYLHFYYGNGGLRVSKLNGVKNMADIQQICMMTENPSEAIRKIENG